MAVLLGLVIGTLIATVMGLVNWGDVGRRAVFQLPQPFFFGAPLFAIGAIISLCIMMLVIMTETTADLLAVGEILDTEVDKKRIAAGLRADTAATAIAPVLTASRSAPSRRTSAWWRPRGRHPHAEPGGLRLLERAHRGRLDRRRITPITVPEIYNHISEWPATIFESGISATAIFAVVLNLAFNHFSRTDEPVSAH